MFIFPVKEFVKREETCVGTAVMLLGKIKTGNSKICYILQGIYIED